MKKFELPIIAGGNLNDKDSQEVHKEILELVKKHAKKVEKENNWGRRALAYPIVKNQFGYYSTFVFESETDAPQKIESALRLNNNIIRFLTVEAYNSPVSLVDSAKKETVSESKSAEESLRRESKVKPKSKPVKERKPEKVEDESKRKKQVEAALEGILSDESEGSTNSPSADSPEKEKGKKSKK